MQTNNHKIVDYDAVLDAKFGKEGTPERARAEEAAYSFYSGQILQDARKEAKMTQSELAERTQLGMGACFHGNFFAMEPQVPMAGAPKSRKEGGTVRADAFGAALLGFIASCGGTDPV